MLAGESEPLRRQIVTPARTIISRSARAPGARLGVLVRAVALSAIISAIAALPIRAALGPSTASAQIAASQTATAPAPVTCLPAELKALIARRPGPRTPVATCELPCLAPPAGMGAEDLQHYERGGVTWCKTCVPFTAYLPLEDIERIERAGNVSLCRQSARSVPGLEGSARGDGARVLRGPRALFAQRRPAIPHGDVAVIVTMTRYRFDAAPAAHAVRDGAAMRALLTERLGYQADNILEVQDPTLVDLTRIFGAAGATRSEVTDRFSGRTGGPRPRLLVYVSGLGSFRAADPGAFLLPVDAERGREEQSGYPLGRLVDNLVRLRAASTTVLLEIDFGRDGNRLIVPPNAADAADALLPASAAPLTLITAADRDQRPLEDPEFGIGLFTRHLIAGLSGAADVAPIGNGDSVVDGIELYVHVARGVGLAARRSFGVTQKPTLLNPLPHSVAYIGGLSN